MEILFKILLIISCLGLIAVVLLQSGRSAGLSGAIGGGAEQLMGKQKARGIDALLFQTNGCLCRIVYYFCPYGCLYCWLR